MTTAPRITKLIALLAILAFALFAPREPLKVEPEPANVVGLLVGYGCAGYAGRIYRAEEDLFPAGGCRDIHRASILDDDT